jgi:hypothetical protein
VRLTWVLRHTPRIARLGLGAPAPRALRVFFSDAYFLEPDSMAIQGRGGFAHS